MNIIENASLLQYNTFQINARAKYLIEIENNKDLSVLAQVKQIKENPVFILGGGSNILFTKDFNGVLLHSAIKDIEVSDETETYVDIKCGSGVNWDQFVDYCVSRNWGGIENLSDIPGNVGAAPVQNIGAYGVEAKDTIIQVEGVDFTTGTPFSLSKQDCSFAYRNSVFKQEPNLFISHVLFRLSKKHSLITNYGRVEEEMEKLGEKSIQTLREVIIKIRQSKLPSVEKLGSGGSFFKNPIVDLAIADDLSLQYPEMPKYVHAGNRFKLSAAWLIDNAKLKGFKKGAVGTYIKQPLVIVNYGGATGKDVVEFAGFVQQKVFEKFAIMLEPEVIFK